MSAFTELIATGKDFGIFDFFLPFLIMFAIFWAVLTKIKLFGDPYGDNKKEARLAKNVNFVIALGGSLYLLSSTEIGFSFATFLSGLFSGAFMVILTTIAFVSILFVLYAVTKGQDPFDGDTVAKHWTLLAFLTVVAAIIYVVSTLISTSGKAIFPGIVLPGFELESYPLVVFPSMGLTSQDIAIIFMVGMAALIMYYVVKKR